MIEKTGGFYGIAGRDFSARRAFVAGQILARHFGQDHHDGRIRIVIGKDPRRSSYMLESALTAGLVSEGADVHLLHVTTSGCVSYITRTKDFTCGVMISGGQEPFDTNGICLYDSLGKPIEDKALMQRLNVLFCNDEAPLSEESGAALGQIEDFYSGRNRYIGYLCSLATRSFYHQRIVLDCANGSAWMIGRAVFDALDATVTVIHDRPNGLNINENCGIACPSALSDLVVASRAHAGFAFDGDGTHCTATDEKGQLLGKNEIDTILEVYLKDKKRNHPVPDGLMDAVLLTSLMIETQLPLSDLLLFATNKTEK